MFYITLDIYRHKSALQNLPPLLNIHHKDSTTVVQRVIWEDKCSTLQYTWARGWISRHDALQIPGELCSRVRATFGVDQSKAGKAVPDSGGTCCAQPCAWWGCGSGSRTRIISRIELFPLNAFHLHMQDKIMRNSSEELCFSVVCIY